MRSITEIIIHCSATAEGRDFGVADVRRWHKAQGWTDVGYHYVVRLDGTVQEGRALSEPGAHCKGHNAHSIGICYVGGLAADGRTPKDTRTTAQRAALRALVDRLQRQFPAATVHGHCEFAAKACPCFDVRAEFGPDRSGKASSGPRLRTLALLAAVAAAASLLFACVASCASSRRTTVRTYQSSTVTDTLRAASSVHRTDHSAEQQRRFRLVSDTVTVRDTVRITERQQGCTLLVERETVRWRDRIRTRSDTAATFLASRSLTDSTATTTTSRTATARTEEETATRHPPNWHIALIFAGLLIAAAAIADYIVYRLKKAAKNK